jgi:hypothetical protein
LSGALSGPAREKTSPFRLSFLPSQVAVAKRRRKMRLSKKENKNHRAAIEGTVREVKHPFPGGKLPVRGLFRITCLIVGSAAMTNVRRIHHFREENRKEERRRLETESGAEAACKQQGFSFSSFLKTLLTGKRSFMDFSNAYLGC